MIIKIIEINYLKCLNRGKVQNVIVLIYIANFKDAQHKRIEIESSATKVESEVQQKFNKKRQKSSSEDNSDYEGTN